MLTKFIEGNGTEYDLAHSYVIGDRISDIQLAKNLGCQGILLAQNGTPDECREWLQEHQLGLPGGKDSHCALIAEELRMGQQGTAQRECQHSAAREESSCNHLLHPQP